MAHRKEGSPTRKLSLIALLCAVVLAASGCAVTGEVENQAYALVMGVDTDPGGGIALTIRIPRIGQGGGDGDTGSSDEAYLMLSAAGHDYAQALENLQWTAARELNLSHLALLIVSDALASETRFPGLIREIAETRHLYTTAAFIVCEGRADDFIEGQETLLGSHLSSDIDAMFEHYAAHGFIPRTTVADLYYASNAPYSDPTGIRAFPDAWEKPAAALIESDENALNAATRTASSRQYLGAALFRDGRRVGWLDGGETLCLCLLTGRVTSFAFEADGTAWALSSTRSPRTRAALDGGRAVIHVDIFLSCANEADPAPLKAALEHAIVAVVKKCQSLGTEPFGFAEKLATKFSTLGDWRAFDWHARFSEADISIDVHVSTP